MTEWTHAVVASDGTLVELANPMDMSITVPSGCSVIAKAQLRAWMGAATDDEDKLAPLVQEHFRTVNEIGVIVRSPGPSARANTTQLREAIAAAVHDRGGVWQMGGVVFIGAGDYALDDTITFSHLMGLRFVGEGMATRFFWEGAADKPVFLLNNSRQCVLEHFVVHFTTPAYAGFQIRRGDGGLAPTRNTLQHISVTANGKVANGVVFGGPGSIDANNDFNTLDNVVLSGYTDTGIVVQGSQSYNNRFVNLSISGHPLAHYGVDAIGLGSFEMRGGFLSGNEVDFRVARSSYRPGAVISGVQSESSQRFMVTADMWADAVVENCRWAGNLSHEDGLIIVSNGPAARLRITNSSFGSGAAEPRAHRFYFANKGANSVHPKMTAYGHIHFAQNTVVSSSSDIFANEPPDEGGGNVRLDERAFVFEPISW